MAQVLTVTESFGDYRPGQVITDADAIKAALETNPAYVVKSDVPDEAPKPAGRAASKPDAA